MRALLIGLNEKQQTRVEVVLLNESDTLGSMYKHIGCQNVTGAGYIGENHCVWADDEALLGDTAGLPMFQVSWYPETLVGRLLITGFDHETGETAPATLSVGQVFDLVHLMGCM